MEIQHINPKGLFRMDGFSQVVIGCAKAIGYIAGQGAIDGDLNIVGKNDYFLQAKKALENVLLAMDGIGRGAKLASSTIYIVNLDAVAVEKVVHALGLIKFPAHAYSLIGVEKLAHPDALVEISATIFLD